MLRRPVHRSRYRPPARPLCYTAPGTACTTTVIPPRGPPARPLLYRPGTARPTTVIPPRGPRGHCRIAPHWPTAHCLTAPDCAIRIQLPDCALLPDATRIPKYPTARLYPTSDCAIATYISAVSNCRLPHRTWLPDYPTARSHGQEVVDVCAGADVAQHEGFIWQ